MAAATPDPASLPPDELRGHPALAIYMWVGCGIATFVIAVRLYARWFLKQAAGWDDPFIAFAYVFALFLYIGTQLLLNHGYGRHIVYISIHELSIILQLNTAVTIAGFVTLALSRASIGIFLLRLVAHVQKWRRVIWVGMVLNVLQAVALIILTGIQCVPISKQWDPTHSGHCINRDRFTIADRFFGCINAVVDLIFALTPFLVIPRLQMPGKYKLAIYLLLSCGLLACVCSIGRVVASKLTTEDPTWDLIPLTYWALSEATGVLILACMPSMYQVVLQISRSHSWGEIKSYMTKKMPGSTHHGTDHTGGVSPHGTNQKGNNGSREPITLTKDVDVHRDAYVELDDQKSSDEVGSGTFGVDRPGYSYEARAASSMV